MISLTAPKVKQYFVKELKFLHTKEFATREALAIISANGFRFVRVGKGGHKIYSNGHTSISIPTNSKSINRVLFARIIKENGLRV